MMISSHLSSPLSSYLTCGASECWRPCCCRSSWLCSTGAAGSWTGGTACCPPRMPAAGPGSERGAAACRRRSWCTASERAAGTGSGWRACGGGAGSRGGAACPCWSPACSRLPTALTAGSAARSGRRAERWWSDAWRCSSWSTRPVLSLVQKREKRIIFFIVLCVHESNRLFLQEEKIESLQTISHF